MEEKRRIIWIYNPAKSWDFGFVDIEGESKGYYVHFFNKKNALPWDKVEAELKTFRWKDEAIIIKILERSDKIFIWHFESGKKNNNWNGFAFWFVVVTSDNLKTDIFIPWKYISNAKTWDLVWVKIVSWENKKNPKWEIVEVLWDDKSNDLSVESYILESWFKQKFFTSIKKDLENISENIDIKKQLESGRKDLRNLFTFTIDGEDAKDLDDAISIDKMQDWSFKLYVHIADVANYIKENSDLDKVALKRATSVYLTDRVIPMLPEKLSNNLCSLNPNIPKLTLTCEMSIWKNWIIKKAEVYESIIESNFRLTYREVDEIENNKIIVWNVLFWWQKLNLELIQKIKESLELKLYIEKNRKDIWSLDFDFPETKILLDDNRDVLEIKEYPKYNSNKLIELFMVSANESIWKLFSNLPFLHRIHPKPSLEDISKLQNTLNLFNINFVLKKFDTKEFSNLLELIKKDKNKNVLEKIVLRTLSKAIYSYENQWHFWLGLNFYSHFTSPIRRYPDLQIHRIIKEKLHKKLNKDRIKHYELLLDSVANVCSNQERKAEKLEYRVRDYYTCKFYKNKVWETFEVSISGLIPKWFFVMLTDTSEWFVSLISSTNFVYNEDLMQFEDKKNKIYYKLWDKLKVSLKEIDFKELRMNFDII